MSDSAANVTEFQDKFVAQLPLDGQVKRIHDVGTEIRVQCFASGRRDVIDSREGRLGKSGRGCWNRSDITISRRCGTRLATVSGWCLRGPYRSRSYMSIAALDRLDQSGAQQGDEDEIHAVQTPVDAAVAATDN